MATMPKFDKKALISAELKNAVTKLAQETTGIFLCESLSEVFISDHNKIVYEKIFEVRHKKIKKTKPILHFFCENFWKICQIRNVPKCVENMSKTLK